LIVRFLRYPQKSFIDHARERRVKRGIGLLVLVVTLPSTYIAFNLVSNTVFEREAGKFIAENFVFDNCQVISKNIDMDGDTRSIEVVLIGEHVSDDRINDLKAKMKKNDRLSEAELLVRQSSDKGLDMTDIERFNKEMKAGLIEDLYKKNDEVLKSKEEKIAALEEEIFRLRKVQIPVAGLKDEIKAIDANIKEYTLMNNTIVNLETNKADTVMFAYIEFKNKPKKDETTRLENWLKARTESDSLKMVVSY